MSSSEGAEKESLPPDMRRAPSGTCRRRRGAAVHLAPALKKRVSGQARDRADVRPRYENCRASREKCCALWGGTQEPGKAREGGHTKERKGAGQKSQAGHITKRGAPVLHGRLPPARQEGCSSAHLQTGAREGVSGLSANTCARPQSIHCASGMSTRTSLSRRACIRRPDGKALRLAML